MPAELGLLNIECAVTLLLLQGFILRSFQPDGDWIPTLESILRNPLMFPLPFNSSMVFSACGDALNDLRPNQAAFFPFLPGMRFSRNQGESFFRQE